MILGSGLLQASGWTPEWLIRDEFTDTVAAGSVDGTAATPGPGTRAATAANVTVGSGYASVTGTTVWTEASLHHSNAITRTTGVALVQSLRFVTTVPASWMGGWRTDQTYNFIGHNNVGFQVGGSLKARYATDGTSPEIMSLTADTDYNFVSVLRSAGRILLAKIGSAWTVLWIDATDSTATVYAAGSTAANTYSNPVRLGFQRVLALPAPFDTDDGLATDTHSGSVASGTTFVHEADCLIEFTVTTLPSAFGIKVHFRNPSAGNYWQIYISASGDFQLYEFVAGSPTVRGSVFGVVSNGHRIVVIADGTTIKGYSNNTLRWTYSSATNFVTETAGELDSLGTGGAVSDVKTWPRTLSGTAAGILNKASA